MVLSTDEDYKITKLIKQKKRVLDREFEQITDWIFQQYNVRPLNLFYDIMNGGRPRLNVIFEFEKDTEQFRTGGPLSDFDPIKQNAIARQFERTAKATKPNRTKSFWTRLFGKTEVDVESKTFIYFSSFEPIAKGEANSSISRQEIDQLKSELTGFNIWDIAGLMAWTTVFCYTDDQVKSISAMELKEMNRKYLNILKKYDEFDYFHIDNFSVKLDSKENFDNNYQSNWYYYFK